MIKRNLSKVILTIALFLASTTFYSTTFYSAAPPALSSVSCHTANLYYEARGESKAGMKAVAAVVINRKNSGKYPKNDCMVIFQNRQFSWTQQQKFKDIQKLLQGDTAGLSTKDRQAYQQAVIIAQTPDKELLKALPKGTLWYHAKYTKPRWSEKMKLVKVVGQHKFYVG